MTWEEHEKLYCVVIQQPLNDNDIVETFDRYSDAHNYIYHIEADEHNQQVLKVLKYINTYYVMNIQEVIQQKRDEKRRTEQLILNNKRILRDVLDDFRSLEGKLVKVNYKVEGDQFIIWFHNKKWLSEKLAFLNPRYFIDVKESSYHIYYRYSAISIKSHDTEGLYNFIYDMCIKNEFITQ